MDEVKTVVSCKNCHEYIEVPPPIKERCQCGLTADTRAQRNWAITLVCVVVMVAAGIVTGKTLEWHYNTKQLQNATEQHRVQNNEDLRASRAQRDQAYAENADLKKQLEKYQTVLDALKGIPQVAEAVKSAQADKK